jgi:hypothetical protein
MVTCQQDIDILEAAIESTTEPQHPFPAAVVARNLGAVTEAITEDVVLISPITSRFRFEGRTEVTELMSVVLETFEDIQVFEEFGAGDRRAVAWRARIGDQRVEGTDILQLDDEGKVREIRLFIRPLPGLATATATLGPRLARRRSKARGAAMAALTRPLAFAIRAGEGIAPRLVRPRASTGG